jgi:hypothetical protein
MESPFFSLLCYSAPFKSSLTLLSPSLNQKRDDVAGRDDGGLCYWDCPYSTASKQRFFILHVVKVTLLLSIMPTHYHYKYLSGWFGRQLATCAVLRGDLNAANRNVLTDAPSISIYESSTWYVISRGHQTKCSIVAPWVPAVPSISTCESSTW